MEIVFCGSSTMWLLRRVQFYFRGKILYTFQLLLTRTNNNNSTNKQKTNNNEKKKKKSK